MKKVLVIDDDMRYRDVVLPYLQSYGYEVFEAATVAAGLKLLQRNDYDLYIVDGILPDGTGINVIKEIRKAGKNVPVIFISGVVKDQMSINTLTNELKVSLVKSKPIVPEQLCKEIAEVMRLYALTKGKANESGANSTNSRPALMPSAGSSNFGSYSKPVASNFGGGLVARPAAPKFGNAANTDPSESDLAAARQVAEEKMKLVSRDYLAHLPLMLAKIRQIIEHALRSPESAEYDELKILSHNLKGTAGMHGRPQIGFLMERIEKYLDTVRKGQDGFAEDSWQSIAESLRKAERESSSS